MINKNNYLLTMMNEHQLEEHITQGQLNLIECPCGAGKTTWVIDYIARNFYDEDDFNFINNPSKVLYIIDTRNNREKVMKEYLNRVDEMYDDNFLFKPCLDEDIMTMKKFISYGIDVETYAYVSLKAKQDVAFFKDYELIICDELHASFKFEHNQSFLDILPLLTESKTVVAISATPKLIKYKYNDIIYDVLGKYKYDLRRFEESNTYEFMSIESFLEENQMEGKTLIYTKHVKDELKIKKLCQELGYVTEYICSESNENYSQAQDKLRRYLLEFEEIPDALDILIINATFETGLNIRNINNVIVNDSNEDIQTQSRGRARTDIEVYAHKFTKESDFDEQAITDVIESYQGQKLFKEQQQELFNELYELGVNTKSKPCKTMKAVNKWLNDNYDYEYSFITKEEKGRNEHRGQRYLLIEE